MPPKIKKLSEPIAEKEAKGKPPTTKLDKDPLAGDKDLLTGAKKEKKKGRPDGRPTVCWGGCECVARMATLIFGMVIFMFNLTCFIITLTFKFAYYQMAAEMAGRQGAAKADAAFDFLVLLPLGVLLYGIYDNKKYYSRIVIMSGTVLTLIFGVVLNIVHIFGMMAVSNATSMDNPFYEEDEAHIFIVMFVYIVLKLLISLALYAYLASSSFKHWQYLGTLLKDRAAIDEKLMEEGLGPNKLGSKAEIDKLVSPTSRSSEADSESEKSEPVRQEDDQPVQQEKRGKSVVGPAVEEQVPSETFVTQNQAGEEGSWTPSQKRAMSFSPPGSEQHAPGQPNPATAPAPHEQPVHH